MTVTELVAQILVLILFGAALFWLNIRSGNFVLSLVTYVGGLAALLAAGYLILDWVFLSAR